MTSDVDVSAGTSMRLYARFSRRLKGLFIDWLLALIVIYCGLSLSIAIGSDDFSRVIGFPIVAALLLYEPVMVSRTSGTIGHHFTNLRVVDEITHDNISFFKAAARSLIKSMLGWFSFLTMLVGKRNQAVHDLLTGSTVQIRDPAKAFPGQYISERSILPKAAG